MTAQTLQLRENVYCIEIRVMCANRLFMLERLEAVYELLEMYYNQCGYCTKMNVVIGDV